MTTSLLEFEIINSLQPLLLYINTSRRKYLFEADDNQTFDSIHHLVLILENRRSFTIKKQTFLISNKVKPQNNHKKKTKKNIIIRYDKNKVTVQMFSGLLTYMIV